MVRLCLLLVFIVLQLFSISCDGRPCERDEECSPQQFCMRAINTCQPLTGVCHPGANRECYTGDRSKLNKGWCRAGRQLCLTDQSWSRCEGEKLPAQEQCDGKDNDCDGQIDEDCASPPACKHIDLNARVKIVTRQFPDNPFSLEIQLSLKDGAPALDWSAELPSIQVTPTHWSLKALSREQVAGTSTWKLTLTTGTRGPTKVTVQFAGQVLFADRSGIRCPLQVATPEIKISCPSNELTCSGICTDIKSSPDHCGACGHTCLASQRCCDGQCTDLISSTDHCGGCGRRCPKGGRCVWGTCVSCRSSGDCVEGSVCRQGSCLRCPGAPGCDRVLWIGGLNADVRLSGISLGKQEEVYLTGRFRGRLNFKDKELFREQNSVLAMKLDNFWQKLAWFKFAGGNADESNEPVLSRLDDKENLYLTGAYRSKESTFFTDKGPGSQTLTTEPQQKGLFAASLTSAGDIRWAFSLGNMQTQALGAFAVDGSGSSWYSFSMHTGQRRPICSNQPSTEPRHSPGPKQTSFGYLKIDARGSCDTYDAFVSQDLVDKESLSLAPDQKGGVYWAGMLGPKTNIQLNGTSHVLNPSDQRANYVVRFSATGAVLWQVPIDPKNPKQLTIEQSTTDLKGNLYLAGIFRGRIQLGSDTLESAGPLSYFIIKLSPKGEFIWAKKFGDGFGLRVSALSLGKKNELYLLGTCSGSWSHEGIKMKRTTRGLLLGVWDTQGRFWRMHSTKGTGTASSSPQMSVHKNGEITIAGSFYGDSFQLGHVKKTQSIRPLEFGNEFGFLWRLRP